MKAIEIKGLKVEFVSYVTSPANKKKFFLVKSEDASAEPNVEKQVRILVNKDVSENEPHLIYGVVYSPGEIDAQNNFMTAEEILKAQHGFLKDYRLIDEQHNKIPGAGEVVECYCSLTDMEIDGETIAKGSWILVTEPDNEVWGEVEKGTYVGYSLYGFAEQLVESEVRKTTIWDKLKELFGIQKDFDKELINYQNNDIWYLFEIFQSAVWNIGMNGEVENGADFKKELLKNLSQLTKKVKEMTFERIEKEVYECECIECGHNMESKEHCKDIKCPECGGTMRRAERPGAGQKTQKEDKAKTQDGEPDSVNQINKNEGVQMDDKLKEEIIELFKQQFDEIAISIADIKKSMEDKVETVVETTEPTEDIPAEDNTLDELKKGFEEIKTRLASAEEAILGSQSNISDTEEVDVEKPGIKTNII